MNERRLTPEEAEFRANEIRELSGTDRKGRISRDNLSVAAELVEEQHSGETEISERPYDYRFHNIVNKLSDGTANDQDREEMCSYSAERIVAIASADLRILSESEETKDAKLLVNIANLRKQFPKDFGSALTREFYEKGRQLLIEAYKNEDEFRVYDLREAFGFSIEDLSGAICEAASLALEEGNSYTGASLLYRYASRPVIIPEVKKHPELIPKLKKAREDLEAKLEGVDNQEKRERMQNMLNIIDLASHAVSEALTNER